MQDIQRSSICQVHSMFARYARTSNIYRTFAQINVALLKIEEVWVDNRVGLLIRSIL